MAISPEADRYAADLKRGRFRLLAPILPKWANRLRSSHDSQLRNTRMMIQPMADLVPNFSLYPQTTENWSGFSRSGDHSFPPGILIGDHDPSIRVVTALKKRGFAVWLAADGEEALDM